MSPTARQMDALRFIRGFQLAKGWTPSVREIAVGINGGKTSAQSLLTGLAKRGLIRKSCALHRTIEVLTDIEIPRAPDGAPLYFVRLP